MTTIKKLIEDQKAINENVEKVFEAGKRSANQAAREKFWDGFQNNGNRTDYNNSCQYGYVPKDLLPPKYDIQPTSASNMFRENTWGGDLVELLGGKQLDFSKATAMYQCFSYSHFTRIGVIDVRAYQALTPFTNARTLITIDKLIVDENTTMGSLNNCNALENIIIEGVIANSANFQWSPLSPESLKSIISCLKDFSGTGDEYTQTIKFSEKSWSDLESDSKAPTGTTWAEYVDTVKCWLI